MKNGGFSVLAAIALLVCALGTISANATGGNSNKQARQICECSNIAVNTYEMNTKTTSGMQV